MRATVHVGRMPGAAVGVLLLFGASLIWAQSDPAQGAKGEQVYLQKNAPSVT